MRKAVTDYGMIKDGDHIAVGLSGGKDSLALLTCLAKYRAFSPEKYKLTAITVDLGFKDADPAPLEALKEYCRSLDVPYEIVKTEIGPIIFDIRKESNPCSLCAKMRRGALNAKCVEIGSNKLALGHHQEDMLETFLLSFMYEGRLSTFQPVSFMSRTGITLIRPMLYAEEGEIKGAAKRLNFPVAHNPCPVNHETQREYMKNLVKNICNDIPFAKDRMVSAITHPERYNLFPKKEKDERENEEE